MSDEDTKFLDDAEDTIRKMADNLSDEQKAKKTSAKIAEMDQDPDEIMQSVMAETPASVPPTGEKPALSTGEKPAPKHLPPPGKPEESDEEPFGKLDEEPVGKPLQNLSSLKKNDKLNKKFGGRKTLGGAHTSQDPGLDRPSAMNSKVAAQEAKDIRDPWKKDARSGVQPDGSYTVHEDFLDEAALAKIEENVKVGVYHLWVSDGWARLRKPPSGLEIKHFIDAIPHWMANSTAAVRIKIAKYNLKVAHARSADIPTNWENLISEAPDAGYFMIDSLSKNLERMEKALVDTTNRHDAMLAVATTNLAKAEQLICNLKHSINATFTDSFSGLEHKMSALTESMSLILNAPDVQHGSQLRGTPDLDLVRKQQAPSMSVNSETRSTIPPSEPTGVTKSKPSGARKGAGGWL